MVKIIGLGHQQRVGKDTMYQYISKVIPDAIRIAFADGVKEVAARRYKLPMDVVMSPNKNRLVTEDLTLREVLQNAGHAERERDEDFWIKYAFGGWRGMGVQDFLEYLKKEWGDPLIVVTDVRYPNEGDFIRRHGGFLVKLIRDVPNPVGADHPSETSMNDFDWDLEIYNREGMPGQTARNILEAANDFFTARTLVL